MKDEHFSFGHLESLDSWPLVLIRALYLDSSNYPGGNCPGDPPKLDPQEEINKKPP